MTGYQEFLTNLALDQITKFILTNAKIFLDNKLDDALVVLESGKTQNSWNFFTKKNGT